MLKRTIPCQNIQWANERKMREKMFFFSVLCLPIFSNDNNIFVRPSIRINVPKIFARFKNNSTRPLISVERLSMTEMNENLFSMVS